MLHSRKRAKYQTLAQLHESARVRPMRKAPVHMLIARALHRDTLRRNHDDGGQGSLGTLTLDDRVAGWASVNAAGCCCANESAPYGPLRAYKSAGMVVLTLALKKNCFVGGSYGNRFQLQYA
jgi:hypothetical protein